MMADDDCLVPDEYDGGIALDPDREDPWLTDDSH